MILDESCKETLGQMRVTKVEDTSITLDGHVVIQLNDNTIEHIMSLYKKKEYPDYVIPITYKNKAYDVVFKPDASEWDGVVLCDAVGAPSYMPSEYFFVIFNEHKNTISVYETGEVTGNDNDGYSASLTGYVIHETSVYDEEESAN